VSNTPHFDRLAAVLFDGAVKVDHIHIERGIDPNVTPERMAAELYASMERTGLIVDGQLRDPSLSTAE